MLTSVVLNVGIKRLRSRSVSTWTHKPSTENKIVEIKCVTIPLVQWGSNRNYNRPVGSVKFSYSYDLIAVAVYCKVPAPGGYELNICMQVARTIVDNKEIGL